MPYRVLALFFLTSTLGIVIYTLYAAFHYSSNAVLGRDEANFIILSSQGILSASNFVELIKSLFPSHGQHTLFGMQLVNMFTLYTFGALDRRIMNVIGVAILCFAALLLPSKQNNKKWEMVFIYATLFPLILSPSHNACIVNASCTGNHYFGIAASVVALTFFTRIAEKKLFIFFAEFFMFLAIFSLPAALALIPISLFILFKSGITNKMRVVGMHLAFIVCILVFHSWLTYPNTIFSFAQNPAPTSPLQMAKDLLMFTVTFFIIVGSLFYWLNDMGQGWLLVLIGVIVTAAVVMTVIKIDKRAFNSFPFYGALLFVLMIAIISFGRYYSFGSSRYSAYTAFLWCMLLLLCFSQLDQSDDAAAVRHRINILVCSAAISLMYFFVALHYHQPYLLDLEQKDNVCRSMWYKDGYACGVMIPHQEATDIIRSALDQGIYRIEQ